MSQSKLPLPATVVELWHPTRNLPFLLSQVTAGSGKKVWWKCNLGHEWERPVKDQVKYKTCPYCSGVRVLQGLNDLQTLNPEVAADWHPVKNLLTPNSVSLNSNKVIWWQCSQGHDYQTTVYKRVTRGHGCNVCANKKVIPGLNDLTTLYPELAEQWASKNNVTPLQVSPGSHKQIIWACKEAHEWKTSVRKRVQGQGCPRCATGLNASAAEIEIAAFIEATVEDKPALNSRKIIPPYELDIYIPEKKVAIEFNGIYWHSEKVKSDKNYHQMKWLACKEQGIQLIQIWEDDWNRNPELIKRMLAQKLGIYSQVQTFIEKTTIENINPKEASKFLNQNHIQGPVTGSIYVGLKVNTNLVACMVLEAEAGNVLNLLRYATSQPVPGGFTKLLKHIEKAYKPSQITIFSDNCVSDDDLYETNGFIAVETLPAEYKYVVKGERKQIEDLTEPEMSSLNNLNRIWDAGKTKWVKTIHPKPEKKP